MHCFYLYYKKVWIALSVLLAVVFVVAFVEVVKAERGTKPEALRTAEKFFADAQASRLKFPSVPDEAQVELYYMEYVMSTWVFGDDPWNVFHSGIGFVVKYPDGQAGFVERRLHAEFIPRLTQHARHVVIPYMEYSHRRRRPSQDETESWLPESVLDLFAWATWDYALEWENQGAVFFHDPWPSKYTNFTRIGRTNGTILNRIRLWLFDYQEKHRAFEPIHVVSPEGDTLLPSHLCHDLFYNALDAMHDLGVELQPEEPIFRDYVVVYSSSVREVELSEVQRKVILYYKLFAAFVNLINEEFYKVRSLFLSASLSAVTAFVYKNGAYYALSIEAPFVNYCYMEVVMPPGKKATFRDNDKLCALGDMSINEARSLAYLLSWEQLAFFLESIVFDWRAWGTLFALVYVTKSVVKSMLV